MATETERRAKQSSSLDVTEGSVSIYDERTVGTLAEVCDMLFGPVSSEPTIRQWRLAWCVFIPTILLPRPKFLFSSSGAPRIRKWHHQYGQQSFQDPKSREQLRSFSCFPQSPFPGLFISPGNGRMHTSSFHHFLQLHNVCCHLQCRCHLQQNGFRGSSQVASPAIS